MTTDLDEAAGQDFDRRLDAARAAHRAGRLADADASYRALLAETDTSADLTGLMAMLRFQQGDAATAKTLWRKAIALPGPASIHHRDLNNLLATLLEEGALDEARALAGAPVPAWPSDRRPDAGELERGLSLVDALIRLGAHATALGLTRSLAEVAAGDARVMERLGLLELSVGENDAAWRALTAAEAISPDPDVPLLTALSASAARAGRRDAAETYAVRAASRVPIWTAPARPTQIGHVLIMNWPRGEFEASGSARDVHLTTNFPTQALTRFAHQFRFSSVIADTEAVRERAARELRPDVVLNNMVSGELLSASGLANELGTFARSFRMPVINPPDMALATTRERIAHDLAGLPGVVSPRTVRFHNRPDLRPKLIREIESQFSYPMIVRAPFAHRGIGMVKVETPIGLAEELERRTEQQIYVTQFVEATVVDGAYRKLRATIVDQDIILTRVDFDPSWNVRSRRQLSRQAFLRANPRLLELARRIALDPVAELGAGVFDALRAIRSRIGLDIFGIDMEVTPGGDVLVYEANASMNLLSHELPEDVRYPAETEEATEAALRQALARRIGAGATRH